MGRLDVGDWCESHIRMVPRNTWCHFLKLFVGLLFSGVWWHEFQRHHYWKYHTPLRRADFPVSQKEKAHDCPPFHGQQSTKPDCPIIRIQEQSPSIGLHRPQSTTRFTTHSTPPSIFCLITEKTLQPHDNIRIPNHLIWPNELGLSTINYTAHLKVWWK